MNEKDDDTKPWLEKRFDIWEVNPKYGEKTLINISCNQIIEIDKLYGPPCAHGVRIRLEYTEDKTDWVVEAQENLTDWVEKARWDCQENWPRDKK